MENNANRKILIIDDNPAIHEDFRKVFASPAASSDSLQKSRAAFLGEEVGGAAMPEFELDFCLQGQEALEAVRRSVEGGCPYAMAFVDIRMPPGWDGVKTIAHLWEVDPDLQVVICTAYSDYSLESIVELLGHTDRLLILKKPFDPAEVRQFAGSLTEKWNTRQRERERLEELQRVNAALEEANRRAEAASRAKTDFLANLSHEIRTPMNAILGYMDLFCDPASEEADREHFGGIIRDSGKHLLAILGDILDISKIEAGHMSVRSLPVDPLGLVREVVSLMRVHADEKGLELGLDCPGEVPGVIESDPLRVRQILMNLVGNAVKFTERGSVRVVVRPAGAAELLFEIVDTGVGIPAQELSAVFDPFSQVDTSTTRRAGGTGLGLSISRRFARMLGGDIELQSEVGRGSAFTLRLPVRRPEEARRDSPTPEGAPGSPAPPSREPLCELAGRVLLVEDTRLNRALITTMLKKAGASVCEAEDGREGLEKARPAPGGEGPFDLIVLDMQMPVMDGYEAARALREEGFRGPILALTAHAMSGDRERCLEAGCDDYATKPVERGALLRKCRALIASAGPDPVLPVDPERGRSVLDHRSPSG